jgi:CBS domain-containing protein
MAQLALRDVMSREFVGVNEADPLLDAVELMRTEETHSAVVLRGSDPVGVVTTERVLDLVVDGEDPEKVTVADVMEDTPESLSLDASVGDAADLMGRTNTPRVLVSDEDGVHGVVEARDVAPVMKPRGGASAIPVEPRGSEISGEETDTFGEEGDTFGEQGVCEVCGNLTQELTAVNGELRCPECQAV